MQYIENINWQTYFKYYYKRKCLVCKKIIKSKNLTKNSYTIYISHLSDCCKKNPEESVDFKFAIGLNGKINKNLLLSKYKNIIWFQCPFCPYHRCEIKHKRPCINALIFHISRNGCFRSISECKKNTLNRDCLDTDEYTSFTEE
jgi:hypothetical protein